MATALKETTSQTCVKFLDFFGVVGFYPAKRLQKQTAITRFLFCLRKVKWTKAAKKGVVSVLPTSQKPSSKTNEPQAWGQETGGGKEGGWCCGLLGGWGTQGSRQSGMIHDAVVALFDRQGLSEVMFMSRRISGKRAATSSQSMPLAV